jgi:hypothetical protein
LSLTQVRPDWLSSNVTNVSPSPAARSNARYRSAAAGLVDDRPGVADVRLARGDAPGLGGEDPVRRFAFLGAAGEGRVLVVRVRVVHDARMHPVPVQQAVLVELVAVRALEAAPRERVVGGRQRRAPAAGAHPVAMTASTATETHRRCMRVTLRGAIQLRLIRSG